jgi:hypothetical protein
MPSEQFLAVWKHVVTFARLFLKLSAWLSMFSLLLLARLRSTASPPGSQMTAIAADNAFSSAGVGLLASAAAHCSSLTHLDLSHCAAGDAGAAALASALLRAPASSSALSSSLRTLRCHVI